MLGVLGLHFPQDELTWERKHLHCCVVGDSQLGDVDFVIFVNGSPPNIWSMWERSRGRGSALVITPKLRVAFTDRGSARAHGAPRRHLPSPLWRGAWRCWWQWWPQGSNQSTSYNRAIIFLINESKKRKKNNTSLYVNTMRPSLCRTAWKVKVPTPMSSRKGSLFHWTTSAVPGRYQNTNTGMHTHVWTY